MIERVSENEHDRTTGTPRARFRSISPRLCVLVDRPERAGRTHTEMVAEVAAGGGGFVQLRAKTLDAGVFASVGRAVLDAARTRGVFAVFNDHVDLAVGCDADGVHVGRGDAPPSRARAALGEGRILGVSARDGEELRAALAGGADYVGVGPVYEARPTKPDAPAPRGLALIETVRRLLEDLAPRRDTRPLLYGIGGIDASTAPDVLAAGADGVAVVSAVAAAPDPRFAVEALAAAVERRPR